MSDWRCVLCGAYGQIPAPDPLTAYSAWHSHYLRVHIRHENED